MKLTHIIFVGIILVIVDSTYIPKYFQLCGRKDPEFEKCVLKSAKFALPSIANGDSMLNIPSLKPLKLPFIQLESSENLQLNLTNIEIDGLDKAEVLNVKADLIKREVSLDLLIKEVKLKGKYNVLGRVLILPISGTGPGEVTFFDGKYTYSFNYDLVTKNGVEFARLNTDSLKFTVKNALFKLENLFNGDKQLSDHMNKFLNENSVEIVKDFEPVIGQTITAVCKQISLNLFRKIPFEQLFLN